MGNRGISVTRLVASARQWHPFSIRKMPHLAGIADSNTGEFASASTKAAIDCGGNVLLGDLRSTALNQVDPTIQKCDVTGKLARDGRPIEKVAPLE